MLSKFSLKYFAVVQACKSMFYLVKGQNANEIFAHFGSFWRKLTSEPQLRWVIYYKHSGFKLKSHVQYKCIKCDRLDQKRALFILLQRL